MVSRDIIQRLLAIINDTRARLNTLESREVALLTATQTLTNKTLTTPTIGNFTNAQHAHTGATSGGTISHGSLTDLTTGDPHTQYLLESVYDANTILKADADNTPIALTVDASTIVGRAATGNIDALTAAQVATIVQSSIDHGSIAGLTDDDHTGYARLAGRSGGQTLIGGTAANDDLTLEGTSNATRTTSYVVLQPNNGNVGIGTTSPKSKLHVAGVISTEAGKFASGPGQWTTQISLLDELGDRPHHIETLHYVNSGFPSGENLWNVINFNINRGSQGSTDVMTLLGNGNVGIGTTSPKSKLHVAGVISTEAGKFASGPGQWTTQISLLDELGDRPHHIETLHYVNSGFPSGENLWNVINFNINRGSQGSTDVMTLLGNGNVGIGTVSPSRKLHVAGTILIDGDEGGIAGTIGLTDVNDATLSTGNGTVKLKTATARDSAGFIKMYVGTTTVWVPYWTNIS